MGGFVAYSEHGGGEIIYISEHERERARNEDRRDIIQKCVTSMPERGKSTTDSEKGQCVRASVVRENWVRSNGTRPICAGGMGGVHGGQYGSSKTTGGWKNEEKRNGGRMNMWKYSMSLEQEINDG